MRASLDICLICGRRCPRSLLDAGADTARGLVSSLPIDYANVPGWAMPEVALDSLIEEVTTD